MQPIRTEELLARVGQVVAGIDPPQEVIPLIEATMSSTEQNWQRFLLESTEDAEMPTETRERIAKALEDYLESLTRMRQAAGSEDLALLATTLDEAEKDVTAIRQAQDDHKATLSAGPTPFPYLNRLLIQYAAVRQGADSMRLVALLDEASSFLQWIRTELATREVDPSDAQTAFHLQQFLEALQGAVLADEALPEVHNDIIELASHLAGLLTQPLLEAEEPGPTPIPAVNQVLQALSSCTGSPEEFDFLLSVLDQCRNYLRTILPVTSPPDVVASLNAVLASLDEMERCLREQIGYEELVASATDLESSATALSNTLADCQDTDEAGSSEFTSMTEGLHVMFRSVLRPAFAFVDGGSDPDTIFAASEHLERAASQMQAEAQKATQGDERLDGIQEALELMNEAAEMLRELASTGNPKMLEIATGLCHQASGLLNEAGIK
jgi:hypothetical protein